MVIFTATTTSEIWKEIELAESYLVCSMFEGAASLSSSILKRLRENGRGVATEEEAAQMFDMLESTGMVLVQSLKELGRTSEILNQLKLCFMSAKFIPAQVLLTGVCLQIADGSPLAVRELIEEFLDGWILEGEQYCTVVAEENLERETGCNVQIVLGIDKYVEIVEFYAVTLLATVLNDVDLAISWVEKASLPEGKRQGILRRLHSMHSSKSTDMSQISLSQSPANNNEACSPAELQSSEGLSKALKGKHPENKKFRSKEVILKLSERIEPCFWCFRSINLKLGNAQFVISKGKIMLGCLILLICYVFRKKQASVKGIIKRQLVAVKRALVDMWQLAFSYQLNPLAGVQPLPAATRGGQ
ncbi:protein APEM9-like [Prosopis cineraria]|uniref:protein APEM9-like n=1 Tax=Prosopis cineraria TaxID=364024 RepID=UPI00240EA895|nr:protein APEM9-like [Prosopis cineraria]